MKAHKIYRKAVHKNLKPFFANWLPSTPIRLGDYGTFKNGIFRYVGHITDDLGITFKARDDAGPDQMEFNYGKGISVELDAKGQIGPGGQPLAKAGLSISFERADSVFFKAADTKTSMISNKRHVSDEIMKLYNEKKWDRQHVVIMDIVESGNTLVAISSEAKGSIAFDAKSDVITSIDLNDASIELELKKSSNIGFTIEAKKGMSLLLGLAKIQKNFLFFDPELRPYSFKLNIDTEETSEVHKDNSVEHFGQVWSDQTLEED